MSKTNKRELGYLLYTKQKVTKQEIADRLGVNKNTVTRWAKEDEWDVMRDVLTETRNARIKSLYKELEQLENFIKKKPEGKQFANKSEADTRTQITRSIAMLEKELTAGNVVDVFTPFIQFVSEVNPQLAKQVVELQDSFIKSRYA